MQLAVRFWTSLLDELIDLGIDPETQAEELPAHVAATRSELAQDEKSQLKTAGQNHRADESSKALGSSRDYVPLGWESLVEGGIATGARRPRMSFLTLGEKVISGCNGQGMLRFSARSHRELVDGRMMRSAGVR